MSTQFGSDIFGGAVSPLATVRSMGHYYRFKRRDVVTIISGRGIYVIWEIPIKPVDLFN